MRAVICPLMVRIRFSDISLMSHRAGTPTRPPPCGPLSHLEPRGKRLGRVYPHGVEPRREGGPFYERVNSWRAAKIHCLLNPTDKPAANDALVDEPVAGPE